MAANRRPQKMDGVGWLDAGGIVTMSKIKCFTAWTAPVFMEMIAAGMTMGQS